MGLVFAYLLFSGPPAILAAVPGTLLLFARRPRLAIVMIIGAILATFPLPTILDRLRTERLAAQGVIVDDFSFVITPWVCGFLYFVFGLIVLGVCHALNGPGKR